MSRKISIVGVVFCAIYAFISLALIALAMSEADPKGKFVLLQLPIVLQMALVDSVGLEALLSGLSWPMAYLFLGLPTLLLLYFVGAQLQRVLRTAPR